MFVFLSLTDVGWPTATSMICSETRSQCVLLLGRWLFSCEQCGCYAARCLLPVAVLCVFLVCPKTWISSLSSVASLFVQSSQRVISFTHFVWTLASTLTNHSHVLIQTDTGQDFSPVLPPWIVLCQSPFRYHLPCYCDFQPDLVSVGLSCSLAFSSADSLVSFPLSLPASPLPDCLFRAMLPCTSRPLFGVTKLRLRHLSIIPDQRRVLMTGSDPDGYVCALLPCLPCEIRKICFTHWQNFTSLIITLSTGFLEVSQSQ